jgi:hypothetical protein
MGFIARQRLETSTFTDAIALEALERVVPLAMIQAVVADADVPTERRRKLPADVTLLLCVAMGLFTREALTMVLHKLVHGLRLFRPGPDVALASESAISQARYRLGARPVVALFHRLCQPLAPARTPGAFRFGLRLMALDGVVEDVPDSPANVRAFGRRRGDRGASAFPQVQGVYPSECGTHTVTDPARPGYGATHRLVTTLLNAREAPAPEVVCAYHDRWEIEPAIDEIDSHQRLVRPPLRSQRPVGVVRELYGLLLAHDAVRAIMTDAAAQAEVAPHQPELRPERGTDPQCP